MFSSEIRNQSLFRTWIGSFSFRNNFKTPSLHHSCFHTFTWASHKQHHSSSRDDVRPARMLFLLIFLVCWCVVWCTHPVVGTQHPAPSLSPWAAAAQPVLLATHNTHSSAGPQSPPAAFLLFTSNIRGDPAPRCSTLSINNILSYTPVLN